MGGWVGWMGGWVGLTIGLKKIKARDLLGTHLLHQNQEDLG